MESHLLGNYSYNFIFFFIQRLRVASHMLYESVADKINYLAFFKDFDMPNTFNSWFLVTELHVWMLLLRSMAEGSETGEDGRFLRNCIVEAMWGDVNTRAKKLGVNYCNLQSIF